ncbi:MAG: ribokinase [Nitrososphaerota archaeon]
MKEATLTIIGTSHMDFIVYVDRFPKIGETVLGSGFVTAPGGKGANQAVAASRLGATCYFISKVGNDFIGESLIENARKNGIKTDYIKKDSRSHSGIALIYVDAKGEDMIVVAPGVDMLISEEDIKEAEMALSSSKVVLTQLEIPIKTAEFAINFAKEMGKKTILNPAPASHLDEKVYCNIDFLTPNKGELEKLSGMKIDDDYSIIKAARTLISKGVGCVIVTLGRRGAMIVTANDNELIPSYDVKVVDTVGAGDAFNGALAIAISLDIDIREAVRFANIVASLKVTKKGAQTGLPSIKEVMAFAKSHGIYDLPFPLHE